MMRKLSRFLLLGFALLFVLVLPAQAQIPVTDGMSIARQVIGYQQQVLGYIRQGLQLENELRNLAQNPMSALGSETGELINAMGTIMSNGKSIGSSAAQLDRNFAQAYKNPMSGNLTDKFTSWHSTNTDTLQSFAKSAGVYMDGKEEDSRKIKKLYDESLKTDGQVQAIGKLSQINTMQIEQMQKLGALLSAQGVAMASDMGMRTAKEQQINQDSAAFKEEMLASQKKQITTINTPKAEHKKWNLY